MYLSVAECLLLFLLWIPSECYLEEHRQFQYNTQVDERGMYNFAYDTSHHPRDAHSLRMEYRDANGIVRGRYGYTDPRGNLRVVEYEAGPDGFKARGDVGPDLFPHMEAPGLSPQKPDPAPTPLRMAGRDPAAPTPLRMEERNPAAPTPLRMAGWDPETDPINKRVVTNNDYYTSYSPLVKNPRRVYVNYYDGNRIIHSHRPSYPVVTQTVDPDAEIFQQKLTASKKKSEPLVGREPVTIYNIDVDPDEIRVAAPPATTGREPSVVYSAPRPTAGRRPSVAYPPSVYRGRDIIATSPEIRYRQNPEARTSHSSHYHHTHPTYNPNYHSHSSEEPRQARYTSQSHSHGQQHYHGQHSH